MTIKVEHQTNDKGERIVILRETTYNKIQKRLSKLEHMEKTAQAFEEIREMKKGTFAEKDAFDLLDEL